MSSDEITSVLVDPYALAPESVRYPNKHIGNVLPEHAFLMNAAATALNAEVKYWTSTREGYVGVYVPDFTVDPARILDLFESLKICVWNWRRTHETQQPTIRTSAAHPDPTDPRD